MKRILVFTIVGVILLFMLGLVAFLSLYQFSAKSIASLPPYPRATTVQTTKNSQTPVSTPALQGSGIYWSAYHIRQTMTYMTSDHPQFVHDYYEKWFTARGWSSSGQPSQGSVIYRSKSMPDISQARLVRVYINNRPHLPNIEIPSHFYTVIVHTRDFGQSTWVWVGLDDAVP